MDIVRHLITAIATTSALIGVNATAAENLECINGGYSAAEQATLDNFVANFSMETWGKGGPPSEIRAVVGDRAKACAKSYRWSPEATHQAMLFKLASIGLAGVENNGPLSTDQIRLLESAMTADDKMRIRAIFDGMEKAQREGQSLDAPTRSADLFIGKLILRAGIPGSPENARAAGGWVAAKALRGRYAESFAAN